MEDFVPYELAVKLKEKGFNMPCIAHYCCLDGNILKFNITTDCIRGSNVKCLNGENNIYTDAPTISQVLKWLREEKDIYISVFIDDDSSKPVTYEIYKNTECVCTHQGEYFALRDWNKCELKAIEYVLDNLI